MAVDEMAFALPTGPNRSGRDDSASSAGILDRAQPQTDERTLIERAQAGDRPAFDELVRRYDRAVLRLATNVLRTPEDARDVYQDAFLKIYKNISRFRFECSFYTWVYRVVTNSCLDHIRRRESRPEDQAPETASQERSESGPDFFDRQAATAPGANPERNTFNQEIAVRIEQALERLTPRERMVFAMKHYQGLKLRVIGETLGTTEETVKNSLFRATRKLRAQLGGLL
jgi:RNA polymerase sigma-70 factor (ECF subfamily)